MRSGFYPRADARVQNFASRYPGARMNPNVLVVHSTETGVFPSYSGGSTAPNLTALPDRKRKRLVWRQHFAVNESARALRNEPGGVETNTLNAVQVELVGTCTKAYRDKYGYFYWPDAPDWALRDLAEFVAWLDAEWPDFKIANAAPRGWLDYPSSYGNVNRQRLSESEWRNAYGILGHQHVPENSHGDPGNLKVARLVRFALDAAGRVDEPVQGQIPPAAPEPREPGRVQRARALLRDAYVDSHGARKRRIGGALEALRR